MLLTLPLVHAERSEAAPLSEQCAALVERAQAFPGRVGLVVLDLHDGTRCETGSTQQFATASLYKIVVLAEAHRQAEAGSFTFDEPLTIGMRTVPAPDDGEAAAEAASTTEGADGDAGTEPGADAAEEGVAEPATEAAVATATVPVITSAEEAARLMIQVSDNGSAEALRGRLGRSEVAAAPPLLGMDATSLGAEFTTAAADIAELLRRIYAGEAVSAQASAAMLELLEGQQISDRLPVGLPAGTAIAHKTGNLEGSVHDAGIVFAPGGDYVIVVLTDTASLLGGSYSVIQELSALAYQAYASPSAPPVAVDSAATEASAGEEEGAVATVLAPAQLLPAGQADGDGTTGLPAALPAVSAATNVVTITTPSGSPWWATTPGLIALLLLAASAFPAALLARRYSPAWRPAGTPAAQVIRRRITAYTDRAAGGIGLPGRNTLMRFGARGAQSNSAEEHTDGAYLDAATTDLDLTAGVASERLRRVLSYFQDQARLLTEMRGEVDAETAPLAALLDRNDQTMERLLHNLEDRLRPLNEYASSEETNLVSLEEQMQSQEMGYIARSFEEYVANQRGRISETREQIERQRDPFVRYGEEQRTAVEAALSRFDEDIAALEQNLAEQRRVMMRMLDAMRSDVFVAAREFLQAREATLAELTEESITDPAQIGARLHAHREQAAAHVTDGVAGSYLRELLEITDHADQRLTAASGDPPGPRALATPKAPPVGQSTGDEPTATEDRTTA